MKDKKEYRNMRVWVATKRRLKRLAAIYDQPMLVVLNEVIERELRKLESDLQHASPEQMEAVAERIRASLSTPAGGVDHKED